MNAVVIICVRTASRRLPGKATRLLAGKPALAHIIDRMKRTAYPVVVALPEHDRLDLPGKMLEGVAIYRGQDDSPLHRMAAVIGHYKEAEWCVRVTHDDVLVDPATAVALVDRTALEGSGYGTSPGIVEGAGVEVIHRDNLLAAALNRKEPTEFVSYFVRGWNLPRPGITRMEPRASIRRPYRLTMDYNADAVLLEAVLRVMGPDADLDDVVKYLDDNRPLLKINRVPELSIYTCAHNAEKWISVAALSVAAVRGAVDLEHVVVDDASTDETLTKLATFYDGQRLTVNERNLGLASSSNAALSECRGRYAMRLDADDHLIGEGFRSEWPAIRAKLQAGAQVVYPAYETREGAQDPRTHHHAGGAVFDKAFLNELRFRDGIRHWDGREIYNRMVKLGANIQYHDGSPTWHYNVRPDSMSRKDPAEREKVLKENGL